MNVGAVTLLSNAGAVTGSDVLWPGGKTALVGHATWGGGNIKLQIKLELGGTATYADVANAALTADGMVVVDLPPGTYRAVSTTSTVNYAKLISVPLT